MKPKLKTVFKTKVNTQLKHNMRTYRFQRGRWPRIRIPAEKADRVPGGTKGEIQLQTSTHEVGNPVSCCSEQMKLKPYLQCGIHLPLVFPIQQAVLILHRDERREVVRDGIICGHSITKLILVSARRLID